MLERQGAGSPGVMEEKLNSSQPHENAAGYAQELLEFLAANRQSLSPLLILPHDYPDPDALAAAFALHFLARECYDIESRIAYSGVIGRTENQAMVTILRIPLHRLNPADLKKYRQVALVDTQPAFENNPFPGNRRATMVIDQHESTGQPATDLALVDTGCGETCVILAQALLLQNIEIPVRVATALAYGILSDTLNLYRAERPDVAQTYLSILHRADMRALARIQNPMRSKRFFVTLGRCIREATVCGRLIVVHLGRIENPDLVSQMAEFLLTYQQSRWSLCTGRYRDKLHVSLRSTKQDGQAGEVLQDVFESREQAGGHGVIAGGSLRVGANASGEVWRDQEQRLQERLMKRLRISTKARACKPFVN
jgi:nanoRNase/pAp phosphatase (c-di-AMP/oligoRNAs hydrolase)